MSLFSLDLSGMEGRPHRNTDGEIHDYGEGDADPWTQQAQHEAASVFSFLQTASDLLENDAPEELIAACLEAAIDEINHALMCLDLAENKGITVPSHTIRRARTGTRGLRRIAWESWTDGWLNEGAAVRQALARAARTPGLGGRVQHQIALEEARHAWLGRRIAEWAVDGVGTPATSRPRC